jgi:tetratricopeptide (TPR) repeat protein
VNRSLVSFVLYLFLLLPASAADNSVLLAEAEQLQLQQNFDMALSKYKEAIDRKPSDAQAYFGMGICYLNMKDLKKAGQALREACHYNPTNKDYAKYLSHILSEQSAPFERSADQKILVSDYAGAIEDIKSALLIQDDRNLRIRLGFLLQRLGRLKEAEDEFRKSNYTPEKKPVLQVDDFPPLTLHQHCHPAYSLV